MFVHTYQTLLTAPLTSISVAVSFTYNSFLQNHVICFLFYLSGGISKGVNVWAHIPGVVGSILCITSCMATLVIISGDWRSGDRTGEDHISKILGELLKLLST